MVSAPSSDPVASRLAPHERLPFLVTTAKQEDETVIRERLQRFIIEATTSPIRRQWELEASLNYKYIENDFYTAEELAEFAERGQPPTKRNEAAPILEQIAGKFIQTRQVATFLGQNTPADDPIAALGQDYLRHNDQINRYEFEEQNITWDGLVGGIGWLKSYIATNELGEKYNKVRALNAFHVYKDPRSVRYNPNDDAKYIIEGSWMDVEDCIALFPEKEDEILSQLASGSGTGYHFTGNVDPSLLNESTMNSAAYSLMIDHSAHRRRVRPFEIWYKRKIRVHYLYTGDGIVALPVPLDHRTAHALVKELGRDFTVASSFQDRMYTAAILGSLLLHHDVSEHHTNLFPYVPFQSGRKHNGAPLPLMSRLVPLVESINKRQSKALSSLSNNQAMAERGAIDNEEEFQIEKARPDGLMLVNEGALSSAAPKVVLRSNTDIGQGQMLLLQEDKDALRRVAGTMNDQAYAPSAMRSGAGVARQQMQMGEVVTPLHNNLRHSRQMKADLTYAYMKQYLTGAMAFRITDDPNAPRLVEMTQDAVQALKERIYDIHVVEQKDYAVLREQQAEILLSVIPQLAQLGPAYVKLGIHLTEWRDKDGLMRLIDEQAAQGPVQPKMSINQDWKDLTAEEKAYHAMALFKSPELAQALLEKGDDPAFLKKLKVESATKMMTEGTKAQVEKGKLDVAAYQTAIEGRLRLREALVDPSLIHQGAASL